MWVRVRVRVRDRVRVRVRGVGRICEKCRSQSVSCLQ